LSALNPGDVLLIGGKRRINAAIKYLTHSNWQGHRTKTR
jgi:hypothetical protein